MDLLHSEQELIVCCLRLDYILSNIKDPGLFYSLSREKIEERGLNFLSKESGLERKTVSKLLNQCSIHKK